MIKLNKQMSVFWIWFGVIVVTFGIGFFIYGINLISTNLNRFVSLHNPVNNNIGATIYGSIEDALFNLEIANYISLAIIICLIILLLFRFHYNKEINTIYIWFLVITLIVGLAFSTYVVSELYINLDSYVNIYNNFKDND